MSGIDINILEKYNRISDSFEDDAIECVLNACFGTKRAIIIKAKNNKRYVKKHLKTYCGDNQIYYHTMRAKKLSVDEVRGKVEIEYVNGQPMHCRALPDYLKQDKQMIVVEGLHKDVDTEVLSAFAYMACLGDTFDIKNVPEDKLPDGSSYVFLADEDFPHDGFDRISSYWRYEQVIYDARDFATQVKEHMGNYKKDIMGIEKDGEYMHAGKTLEYVHILPKKDKWKNILEFDGSQRIKDLFSEDILHKYFHHLNSSQAMCINFFYPLIIEQALDQILRVLCIDGDVDYDQVAFEKVSPIDSGFGRATNFDFYLSTTNGKKVYFEIKYTESEFGIAKDDQEHQSKYENLYKNLLMGNEAIQDKYKQKDMFFKNYQIIRNLLHIDSDSTVVFIYPKDNIGIRSEAKTAKDEIIKKNWSKHFIPITWEELFDRTMLMVEDCRLKEYYENKYKAKYLKL